MRWPGPAYQAIVASFVLLIVITIAGRLQGHNWDTISQMITRSPRLRNAFAIVVGWIILCQLYYVVTMYHRWARIARANKPNGVHRLYWPLPFVVVGILCSVGGSVGFAIVSTDISKTEHTGFAGVAFAGMYIYLATFAVLSRKYPGTVLWDKLAYAFMCIPILSVIVWAAWRPSEDYYYVWEYVYLCSVFGAACALYVYPSDEKPGNYPYNGANVRLQSAAHVAVGLRF